MNQPDSTLTRLFNQVANQKPYSFLTEVEFSLFTEQSKAVRFEPGQPIIRPDELPQKIFLILEGKVRLLAKRPNNDEVITLDRRGSGQLVGWASLLRCSPCEWVTASETTVALSLASETFISLYKSNSRFADSFQSLVNLHEQFEVARQASLDQIVCSSGWSHININSLKESRVLSFKPGDLFHPPAKTDGLRWFVSTAGIEDFPVGLELISGCRFPSKINLKLDIRCVGISTNSSSEQTPLPVQNIHYDEAEDLPGASLHQLGILENDALEDDQRFPIVRARGELKEALAVCEMIALHQQAPFRNDVLQKM